MKRIAFTLIGGKSWVGGYNYQVNLLSSLALYEKERIQACLFLGVDVDDDILNRFKQIAGLEIAQSAIFNTKNTKVRLLKALICGNDSDALKIFTEHKIDVVFEVANFYGWRFPIPAIAWIPDFQHLHLSYLFSKFAYCKRELGFYAQIFSRRYIMLSSEDARKSCEHFYPKSIGKTFVVKFAVSAQVIEVDAKPILALYKLPKHFFFLPNQFWKHKNHKCVIDALKIARDGGQNFVVAVSGMQLDTRDETYFPSLKKLIEENKLEQNFRLLGVIPYQHIQVLMSQCSALINPSKFEGWSTTVEEAKSLGVPMILSSLAVHKEQALDNAYYFDADSPMDLAKVLQKFRVVKDSKKSILQEKALQNALNRVASFAKDFVNLAYLASSSIAIKKIKN